MTVSELRRQKRSYNDLVFAKLRAQDFVEDIWRAVEEDQALGAVGPVIQYTPSLADRLLFCRRLTVRELREKGWRTRCVDHETECGLNPATQVTDRTGNGSLFVLISAVLLFFTCGLVAR